MTNKAGEQPTITLLPCPFCGGEPSVSSYETESLWSHNQVTYTKVYCGECDVGFDTEEGMIPAQDAWNTRTTSLAAQDGLVEAAERALNYLANTEDEFGISLGCAEALRESLAAIKGDKS